MQVHRTVKRPFHLALIMSLVFGFFAVLQASPAQAQTRVNDKDMQALMRNLRDDAKTFRPEFNKAIHKSTIRKTSQEKDDRKLVENFERQTNNLVNRFKKDRNGHPQFINVMNLAEQIDPLVNTLDLGPQVTQQWEKIRTELHQIADAYGVPERFHHRGTDM